MYGIPLALKQLIEAEQDGKCLICEQTPNKLFVDHNHTTKQVRGLLCSTCNSLLGFAKDRIDILQKAIGYLNDAPNREAENRRSAGMANRATSL